MTSPSPREAFPTWQHRVVKTYMATDGTKIAVEAGLHYLPGNSRPYFSVVGEVRYARADKRGHRYYRREPDACGCCHEEFLEAIAGTEDAGSWRDLIALHLSDDQGKPMHSVANACYHLGIGKYAEANDARAQSHLRLTDKQFADLKAVLAGLADDGEREAHVRDFALRLAEAWQQEAQRGIEVLKRLAGANDVPPPEGDDLKVYYNGLGLKCEISQPLPRVKDGQAFIGFDLRFTNARGERATTLEWNIGIGHVDWKQAAKGMRNAFVTDADAQVIQLIALGKTLVDKRLTAQVAAMVAKAQGVAPAAEEVLARCCADGLGAMGQSRKAWCAEFGYDRLKGVEVYEACLALGHKVTDLLGREAAEHLAELGGGT